MTVTEAIAIYQQENQRWFIEVLNRDAGYVMRLNNGTPPQRMSEKLSRLAVTAAMLADSREASMKAVLETANVLTA